MKLANWTVTRMCLMGGLLFGTVVSQTFAQDHAAGVVRITKARKAVQQTGFSDVILDVSDASEEALQNLSAPQYRSSEVPVQFVGYHGQMSGGYGPDHGQYCDCNGHSMAGRSGWCNICGQDAWGCHHRGNSGRDLLNYLHCKFGYFCPSGSGGAGSPWFGHYSRVYPQDVNHFDQRDGQLYSAQGYGVPVAVPLAPVVGHSYNYGWGVPSSRLTPISTVAPRY